VRTLCVLRTAYWLAGWLVGTDCDDGDGYRCPSTPEIRRGAARPVGVRWAAPIACARSVQAVAKRQRCLRHRWNQVSSKARKQAPEQHRRGAPAHGARHHLGNHNPHTRPPTDCAPPKHVVVVVRRAYIVIVSPVCCLLSVLRTELPYSSIRYSVLSTSTRERSTHIYLFLFVNNIVTVEHTDV